MKTSKYGIGLPLRSILLIVPILIFFFSFQFISSCAQDDCNCSSDDDTTGCEQREWPVDLACDPYEEGESWFSVHDYQTKADSFISQYGSDGFQTATIELEDDSFKVKKDQWQLTIDWLSKVYSIPFFAGQTVNMLIDGTADANGQLQPHTLWILDEEQNTLLFQTSRAVEELYQVEKHFTIYTFFVSCEYLYPTPPPASSNDVDFNPNVQSSSIMPPAPSTGEWEIVYRRIMHGTIDGIGFQYDMNATYFTTTSVDGNYKINMPYNYLGTPKNSPIVYAWGEGEGGFLLQLIRMKTDVSEEQ